MFTDFVYLIDANVCLLDVTIHLKIETFCKWNHGNLHNLLLLVVWFSWCCIIRMKKTIKVRIQVHLNNITVGRHFVRAYSHLRASRCDLKRCSFPMHFTWGDDASLKQSTGGVAAVPTRLVFGDIFYDDINFYISFVNINSAMSKKSRFNFDV